MSRVLKTGSNQITVKYGNGHTGVDVVKYKNQKDIIIAHTGGKVVFCQTGQKNNPGATGDKSYGNCVKIDHGNGYFTLYAHLDTVKVKYGQTVSKGQELGMMGNTGNSYGAHLHFEVRQGASKCIDPTPYLDTDLPNTKRQIDSECRTWDNVQKQWLPKVKNNTDYAGNFGHTVGGFQCVTYGGGTTKIISHNYKGGWNSEVVDGGFGGGNNQYSGCKGTPMDAISIWSKYGDATYRVHYLNGGWSSWVCGKYGKSQGQYAGTIGKPIDAIQFYIK